MQNKCKSMKDSSTIQANCKNVARKMYQSESSIDHSKSKKKKNQEKEEKNTI